MVNCNFGFDLWCNVDFVIVSASPSGTNTNDGKWYSNSFYDIL